MKTIGQMIAAQAYLKLIRARLIPQSSFKKFKIDMGLKSRTINTCEREIQKMIDQYEEKPLLNVSTDY